MTGVNGIQGSGGVLPTEPTDAAVAGSPVCQTHEASDTVEISTAAKLAMKVGQVPDVRTELVASVKAQIAAGTYETPQRMEIAIDRLVSEVFPDL